VLAVIAAVVVILLLVALTIWSERAPETSGKDHAARRVRQRGPGRLGTSSSAHQRGPPWAGSSRCNDGCDLARQRPLPDGQPTVKRGRAGLRLPTVRYGAEDSDHDERHGDSDQVAQEERWVAGTEG
jgi:hypothetical protein